ncbi:DUF4136 domain-containing protein [Leptospira sp. WS60.C2]
MKKYTLLLMMLIISCRTVAITTTDSRRNMNVKPGRYKLISENNDIKANFLGKIIDYKLNKIGFSTANDKYDFLIKFNYTVTDSREIKSAYSYTNPYGYTTTTFNNTRLYIKYLKIVIEDNKSNLLWESQSKEEGWCPNIISTSPELVVSIFQNFPNDSINVRREFNDYNGETSEIKSAFSDTNWSCQ